MLLSCGIIVYKCKYFKIHELVSREIYNLRGEKAWQLLDERALRTLDRLRERYGSITVNNWYWGGDREWSGLRTPDSPYYRLLSQHTYGRSFDLIFKHVTAEYVRQDILNYPEDVSFELINSIELDTSWLHFDVRNSNRILTYSN